MSSEGRPLSSMGSRPLTASEGSTYNVYRAMNPGLTPAGMAHSPI